MTQKKKPSTSIEKPSHDLTNLAPQDRPLLSGETPEEIPPEVLEAVPEPYRETLIQMVRATSFQGPLPPPEMFEQYNQIHPGTAERLLQMIEKEQDHRMQWENQAIRTTARGQWLGTALALAAMVAAGIISVFGSPTVAIFVAGGGLLGPLWNVLRKFLDRGNGEKD